MPATNSLPRSLSAVLILLSEPASVFSQTNQDTSTMKSIKASIEAAESDQTYQAYQKAALAIRSYQPKSLEQKRERIALSAKLIATTARRIQADSRRAVKKPVANVALPPGVTGLAGMAPESISDPALRKEYEAAIAENKKNAEFWMEHGRREQMLRGMISPFVSDMLAAYPSEEDLEKRITSILTTEGVPSSTIRTIIERYASVNKRLNPTSEKIKPETK